MEKTLPRQKQFDFPKAERITRKKELDLLFNKGFSFFIYPFQVFVVSTNRREKEVKILLSASKRKFKKAFYRNKLKRQMREAYRKNKHSLTNNYPDQGVTLLIAIVYAGQKTFSSQKVEQKIQAIIQRLLSLHNQIPHFTINQNKKNENDLL